MDKVYKNVTVDKKINFIINIGIDNNEAYIKIKENINNKYFYLSFSKDKYEIHSNYIKIDGNYFYDDYIELNINDANLKLSGFLYYSDLTPLKNKYLFKKLSIYLNRYNPNKVISSHHYIDGILTYNDFNIDFEDGIGFIKEEKNTNKSFVYIQTNILNKEILDYKKVAFNLFVNETKKTILSHFNANIIINDQEYNFTNYNGSKLTRILKNNNVYQYILSKGKTKLIIHVKPILNKNNFKYHDAIIYLTLTNNKKIIFKQKMANGLYEKRLHE